MRGLRSPCVHTEDRGEVLEAEGRGSWDAGNDDGMVTWRTCVGPSSTGGAYAATVLCGQHQLHVPCVACRVTSVGAATARTRCEPCRRRPLRDNPTSALSSGEQGRPSVGDSAEENGTRKGTRPCRAESCCLECGTADDAPGYSRTSGGAQARQAPSKHTTYRFHIGAQDGLVVEDGRVPSSSSFTCRTCQIIV